MLGKCGYDHDRQCYDMVAWDSVCLGRLSLQPRARLGQYSAFMPTLPVHLAVVHLLQEMHAFRRLTFWDSMSLKVD